jgi:putative CocE/NonD family hydrolase
LYTLNGSDDYSSWPTVSYYVMGDVDTPRAPGNEWRYADDWPIPFTDAQWYFHGDGVLTTDLPGIDDPLPYVYDPIDPVPTIGGKNLFSPAGPYDQRPLENRSDVLVFTSPVLEQPYEATGPVTARLFVSSDCPDTDFTVKLTDVYPDGRSMFITDGILRMRNRNGQDHWEFMQSGTTYEIVVDLWSTSYIWNTGHCIRVEVSSSNYPRFLNNPNTVDRIGKNTTTVIAHNNLYVDTNHPSCIILPEPTPGMTKTITAPIDRISKNRGNLFMVPLLDQ